MRNLYLLIGLGVLSFAGVVVSFIFFDFWQQEKDKVNSLAEENNRLERQIKASESNTDANLLKIGKEYVEKVFTYTESDYDRGLKVMGDYYTKSYKKKLKKIQKEPNEEGVPAIGRSRVKIMEAVYNKQKNDKAKVIVTFEQTTSLDGLKTKVLYDSVLHMVYTEDGWKINDMQLIEKI